MDKDSKQTFTHRKRKWLLLLLLLLMVGGIGFYYWFSHRAIVIEPQDSFPEVTKASKMNDQKLKEYANQRADETAMTVNVYPEVTISSANNQGQMWVQNLPTNVYGQEAELILAETGELLYSSGMLEPGYQNTTVTLEKYLEKGDYPAQIKLAFYNLKTKKLEGKTTVDATIHVD